MNEDKVGTGEACPNCFEERVDWLVWDENGELVTCSTCGTTYNPEFEGGIA